MTKHYSLHLEGTTTIGLRERWKVLDDLRLKAPTEPDSQRAWLNEVEIALPKSQTRPNFEQLPLPFPVPLDVSYGTIEASL